MDALRVIFHRFVRLLPLLATPLAFSRFHRERFEPYRHAWKDVDDQSSPGYARPYLRWTEMNYSGLHRGEPFC